MAERWFTHDVVGTLPRFRGDVFTVNEGSALEPKHVRMRLVENAPGGAGPLRCVRASQNLLTRSDLLRLRKLLSTPHLRAQVRDHEMQAVVRCLAEAAACGPDDLAALTAEVTALL